MNKNGGLRAAVVVGALLCSPAHAVTLTASGVFDVENFEVDGNSEPDGTGEGLFDIVENRITEFEFSFEDFFWDFADVFPKRCVFCIPQGTTMLDQIIIAFADEQGSGRLIWSFGDGNFSLSLNAGPFNFAGHTSENGQASGVFREFTHQINLLESGTLPIFALGLLGWGLASIRRRVTVGRASVSAA
jgi:hypothetical protein